MHGLCLLIFGASALAIALIIGFLWHIGNPKPEMTSDQAEDDEQNARLEFCKWRMERMR